MSAETSSYLSGKRIRGLVHCAEKGPKSRGLGGGSHHTQLKESMPTSSQSPGGCLHLQHVHLRQPPEGTICQLADVVSLKLQHLQAIEALERETLNQPNPIPIQVPMEMKPSGHNIPCVHLACTIPRSSSRFLSQWGNYGGGVLGEPRVRLSWQLTTVHSMGDAVRTLQ